MLRLTKQAIGKFCETGCMRQLYLNLCLTAALDNKRFPERKVQPAIQTVREVGEQWEAEKINDLF